MTVSRRILRIIATLFIGGLLFIACIFGLAVYAFWCPVSVTATREHIPAIMAPPESIGQPIRRVVLAEPRLRIEELETDRMMFTTTLSTAEVFAFYQQHLVEEGWEPDYYINQQTNQMFISNKQACPFYAIEINVRSQSQNQTQVIIDPYWPDSPECGDCN